MSVIEPWRSLVGLKNASTVKPIWISSAVISPSLWINPPSAIRINAISSGLVSGFPSISTYSSVNEKTTPVIPTSIHSLSSERQRSQKAEAGT
jgi:hypothetical protein